MKSPYFAEHVFLALVAGVSVAGFWTLYLGPGAEPNGYHHLHLGTNLAWLALLSWQLRLVATREFRAHRLTGLAVMGMGPLLFASAAMLSVHSARKGLASGQGDFMIVQNVMVTLELGLFLWLAFLLRRRRALHGALLLGTGVFFFGIALFFSLISFVPAFRIEGPETFHRFAQAGMAGQAACLGLGLLMCLRSFRTGWPYLLAALCFPLNDLLRTVLAARDALGPLTEAVGSLDEAATFAVAFVGFAALLASTGVLRSAAGAGPVRASVPGQPGD